MRSSGCRPLGVDDGSDSVHGCSRPLPRWALPTNAPQRRPEQRPPGRCRASYLASSLGLTGDEDGRRQSLVRAAGGAISLAAGFDAFTTPSSSAEERSKEA